MKLCFNCNENFTQESWICPNCNHTPALIENHYAFAPELAGTSEGYEAKFFAPLAEVEAGNFWFRARNQLIIWALQHYFPNAHNFLEIGCGTGFVLSGIQQAFPNMSLSGSEIFSQGLEFAKQRVMGANLFQMDARKIPFVDEFAVIGAFDVLEHIQEDAMVLNEMYKSTMQGGGIMLTVPQHPWLWSYADEYAHHVRRYQAQELKAKVETAGFRVLKMTSFVSLLLPIMMLARFKKVSKASYDPMSEFRINRFMNAVLEMVLNVERGLIQTGVSFPMGGSLLVLARKPG
jgi:SAM-dependent methyltransferase